MGGNVTTAHLTKERANLSFIFVFNPHTYPHTDFGSNFGLNLISIAVDAMEIYV